MRGLGSWRNIRLWLALGIFVATLALLLGGQGLAETIGVKRPLSRAIMAIPGVRGYELAEGRDGSHLLLALDRVPDLERVVERALAAVEEHGAAEVVSIDFRDRRAGLENALYHLRFSLEEAMATGRYTALEQSLDRLAAKHRLGRARIYLDRRFILVQLERGRAYLYEAMPRPAAADRAQEGDV
ncbi:MAG: hypothetical protein ACM3XS_04585 [Bacteroidota bacterium]